jgi:hypothetical protein
LGVRHAAGEPWSWGLGSQGRVAGVRKLSGMGPPPHVPRQRKPPKTTHESADGGLNVRFEKFVGVQYLVLLLGVENQITHIDEGRRMDFSQF